MQIGILHQTEAKTVEDANERMKISCNICTKRKLNIECSECEIKKANSLKIALINK